jgi:hypothetical protein
MNGAVIGKHQCIVSNVASHIYDIRSRVYRCDEDLYVSSRPIVRVCLFKEPVIHGSSLNADTLK